VLTQRVLDDDVEIRREMRDIGDLPDAGIAQLLAGVGLHGDRHVLHVFRALLRSDDDFEQLVAALTSAAFLCSRWRNARDPADDAAHEPRTDDLRRLLYGPSRNSTEHGRSPL
jgi:hypothetical protein